MKKKIVGMWVLGLLLFQNAFSQVDTTFIYQTGTPFGTLDIRIAKSATRYYYLEDGKTFSFRESAPGVKTNTFKDMTSWDSSPYSQGNLREHNGSSDAFIMNYRLLLPQNYNPSIADGYPLILMVHGLGERGNCWDNTCHWDTRSWKPSTNTPAAPATATSELLNNDHNLLHGGSIHLDMRNAAGSKLPNDPTLPDRSFPGFVLFPQNLNGWDGGQAQDVIRIVRLLVKKYKIDPDRIYIHGLSNGGAYVYDIVKRAPWLFSAAAPMSPVGDGAITTANLYSRVSSVPFWIFQGALDTNPTPGKTEGYIRKFKENGLSIRYTKYSNLGHGTWNAAYNEPDFFTWLRSKHKSTIHVFGDNPTLCMTTGQGVRMDLAPGFLAYEWELNGVTIPGADSSSYTATETGSYRARFSRISATPSAADWNEWSAPVTVTSSSPTQAAITQTGTVILKDLNNYNYAHLFSTDTADHYYWYKDGVLLNLPGSLDDTTRYVKLSQGDCTGACTGNGQYTLVTAASNNCPSPVSEPISIIFNNQAPVNITAPTTFTGSATGQTTTTVNWTDTSPNENGFEVWRRKQTGTSTYTKWALAKLTGPDVSTLNDTKLDPGSLYQYKVRAVSASGRSNYTPSASNQYLVITTEADNENPTVPQSLVGASTGIKEVTLSWEASTDNTGIREYNIYYGSSIVSTGNITTTYVLKDLALNTNYTFTVRAKDLGGNLSAESNSASVSTSVNGLYYEHSTGAWNDLDAIDWNIAEVKGTVPNFTLAPRTQEDYFNFEFDGYLYITNGGSYEFQTTSDDGSRLTLNNTVLVENDGLHGNVTKTSTAVTLAAGPHTINVKFFEYEGGQTLIVRYRGADTGNNWVNIPNAALTSGSSVSMMVADTEGVEEYQIPAEESGVNVYPNPIRQNEGFTVQMDVAKTTQVYVSLLDMKGTTYFEGTFDSNTISQGTALAHGQKLDKGMYVILIKQDDRVVRRRLIVKD
jgi:hypothetical protein